MDEAFPEYEEFKDIIDFLIKRYEHFSGGSLCLPSYKNKYKDDEVSSRSLMHPKSEIEALASIFKRLGEPLTRFILSNSIEAKVALKDVTKDEEQYQLFLSELYDEKAAFMFKKAYFAYKHINAYLFARFVYQDDTEMKYLYLCSIIKLALCSIGWGDIPVPRFIGWVRSVVDESGFEMRIDKDDTVSFYSHFYNNPKNDVLSGAFIDKDGLFAPCTLIRDYVMEGVHRASINFEAIVGAYKHHRPNGLLKEKYYHGIYSQMFGFVVNQGLFDHVSVMEKMIDDMVPKGYQEYYEISEEFDGFAVRFKNGVFQLSFDKSDNIRANIMDMQNVVNAGKGGFLHGGATLMTMRSKFRKECQKLYFDFKYDNKLNHHAHLTVGHPFINDAIFKEFLLGKENSMRFSESYKNLKKISTDASWQSAWYLGNPFIGKRTKFSRFKTYFKGSSQFGDTNVYLLNKDADGFCYLSLSLMPLAAIWNDNKSSNFVYTSKENVCVLSGKGWDNDVFDEINKVATKNIDKFDIYTLKQLIKEFQKIHDAKSAYDIEEMLLEGLDAYGNNILHRIAHAPSMFLINQKYSVLNKGIFNFDLHKETLIRLLETKNNDGYTPAEIMCLNMISTDKTKFFEPSFNMSIGGEKEEWFNPEDAIKYLLDVMDIKMFNQIITSALKCNYEHYKRLFEEKSDLLIFKHLGVGKMLTEAEHRLRGEEVNHKVNLSALPV